MQDFMGPQRYRETRSLRTRGGGQSGQAYQSELTGGWQAVAYCTSMLVILSIEEVRRGGPMSSHPSQLSGLGLVVLGSISEDQQQVNLFFFFF